MVVDRLQPSPQQNPAMAWIQPCSPGVHSAPHAVETASWYLPREVQLRWRTPMQVGGEPGVQSAKQVPWMIGWFSQRPLALQILCTVPLQVVARGVQSAPQRIATIGSSCHCPYALRVCCCVSTHFVAEGVQTAPHARALTAPGPHVPAVYLAFVQAEHADERCRGVA